MMEEQKKITMKGGTMRLGAYPCDIKEGTLAHRIYGKLQSVKDIAIVMNSTINILHNLKTME